MLKKGQKLYSIVKFKCPHCHEGDFFKSQNPYNFKSMSQTNMKCSICNRSLHMEPGFYYGAMYVSYALGVAHIVTFMVAAYVLNLNIEFWNFVYIVGGILIIATPLYYALSKTIWANLFMNFKEKESGKS